MRFVKYIVEKSFEMEDIPRTFRVVIDLGYKDYEKTLEKLSTMKLDGMTGISSSNDIAFSWLGVARDAMLIMNGQEVVKLNKISRVMYDNPHYLLSNNMYGLQRIFNKGKLDENLMFNVLEYYFRALTDNNIVDKNIVQHSAPYQTLSFNVRKIKTKINGVKDFIKWFRKSLEYENKEQEGKSWPNFTIMDIHKIIENTPDAKLEKSVYDMAELVSKVYGDESEWVIKDKILKIPKKSYLYILVDEKKYKKFVKMKEEDPESFEISSKLGYTDPMKKYEAIHSAVEKYGLDKKYNIKYIDITKWKEVQSLHLSRG